MIKVNDKLEISRDKTDELIRNKKILIFDFDGTIADTEPLHWKAYNELLNNFNVTLLEKDIQKYIGHSELQIYSMIKNDFLIDFDEEEFLKKRLSIYLNLAEKENIQPYKFINEILNRYKENCIYVLVTSQMQNIIERLLSLWKIDSFFMPDYRFYCNKGKTKKDDIYKDIEKYINISNINYKDIVVFEDTEYYLSAARKLGISTIGIEHQYNVGKLKSCDLIVSNNSYVEMSRN